MIADDLSSPQTQVSECSPSLPNPHSGVSCPVQDSNAALSPPYSPPPRFFSISEIKINDEGEASQLGRGD